MTNNKSDLINLAREWLARPTVSILDGVHSLVAEMLAEIEGDRWQDISTAPKSGRMILVAGGVWGCDESGHEIIQAELKDVRPAFWMQEPWEQWVAPYASNDWFKPTHWQPLPTPPKQEKNDE